MNKKKKIFILTIVLILISIILFKLFKNQDHGKISIKNQNGLEIENAKLKSKTISTQLPAPDSSQISKKIYKKPLEKSQVDFPISCQNDLNLYLKKSNFQNLIILSNDCKNDLTIISHLNEVNLNLFLNACTSPQKLNELTTLIGSFNLDISKKMDKRYMNQGLCNKTMALNFASSFEFYYKHVEEINAYSNVLFDVIFYTLDEKTKAKNQSYKEVLQEKIFKNLLNSLVPSLRELSSLILRTILIYSYADGYIEQDKNFVHTLTKYKEFQLINFRYHQLKQKGLVR